MRSWLFFLFVMFVLGVGVGVSRTPQGETFLGGESSLGEEVVNKIGGILGPASLGGQKEDSQEMAFVFGSASSIDSQEAIEDPGPPLTQFNSFLGQRAPFVSEGSLADNLGITSYQVQPGDTAGLIAKRFGITTETVLSANDLRHGDYIRPGEVLLILPLSGVLHKVSGGESLSAIAKRYGVASEEIAKFNLLVADGSSLEAGQLLVVPGGKKYIGVAPPAYGKSLAEYDDYYSFPTTGRNWGREHGNGGVDISNSCGTEVYAAAGGKVIEVKTTQSTYRFANGGYGNLIKISHSNGSQTLYAHLLTPLVNEGDNVSKGQLIAWMGGRPGAPGTGNSTGCHLHFEVRGARNPFLRY
ncbi:LysM peptidoglycan-binding domain-containing protein [Candidatus Parcubacteria bacterium]|nr:MAG: LysM peptidoglycan-binding domain-containing protein [Candidatus Parcubacteria bacterium]